MSAQSTLEQVNALPMEEQLELVFQIWDKLVDSGAKIQPSPELVAELNARWEKHKADPSQTMSWEEVCQSLPRGNR